MFRSLNKYNVAQLRLKVIYNKLIKKKKKLINKETKTELIKEHYLQRCSNLLYLSKI